MARLSRFLAAAARRIAANPGLQTKVTEVVEKDIKPRAEEAWRKHKPKLEAKAAEIEEQVRKKVTRENLEKLAGRIRDRFGDKSKRG